eukprot:gene15011-21079_t
MDELELKDDHQQRSRAKAELITATAFNQENPDGVIRGMIHMLSAGHNFKSAQLVMMPMFSFDLEPKIGVALEIVDRLLTQTGLLEPSSSTVLHLLFDAVPQDIDVKLLEPYQLHAASMFESACLEVGGTTLGARLVVKLASMFKLNSSHLQDTEAIGAYVSELLLQGGTLSPAVSLLMQFEVLVKQLDIEALLSYMVSEGHELAFYVSECIDQDRLKFACKAVRMFNLQESFPTVEADFNKANISKLVRKRLWSVASSRVGNDIELQTLLLREMVAVGEMALVEEYRRHFDLPDGALDIDPLGLDAETKRRAETYLQLEVPLDRLLFVDSRESLKTAATYLHAATVIGLDVEWKPGGVQPRKWVKAPEESSSDQGSATASDTEATGVDANLTTSLSATSSSDSDSEAPAGEAAATSKKSKREQNPASLLQVGTMDRVFLFDLIALREEPGALDACLLPVFGSQVGTRDEPEALDACLLPVFGSQEVLKLGFEISGDLSTLAASYPAVKAFKCVNSVLDLKELWIAYQSQLDSRAVS